MTAVNWHLLKKKLYEEFSPKLNRVSYGSPEYMGMLEQIRPALNHHYQTNRHHPEFYPNGINNMTLVDLSEMICDWYASSLRAAKGDINRSIEINKERFGISDQLYQILCNTIGALRKGEL